jgi:hypothetical protein
LEKIDHLITDADLLHRKQQKSASISPQDLEYEITSAILQKRIKRIRIRLRPTIAKEKNPSFRSEDKKPEEPSLK